MILSVPLAIGGFLIPGPVIGVFGLEPAAAAIGVEYMRVTMGTAVVLTGLFIGNGVLRGAGDSRTPMIITTFANILNIPLAYGMIYGQFGLPALAAVGSAWATFIARGVALVILVIVLWRGRAGLTIRGRGGWRPNFDVARRVLNIGVPAAFEQILVTAAFVVGTIVVGHLGTAVFAANRISFIALSLSFLPGFGFAIAATALMGQSVGARKIEEGSAVVRVAAQGAMLWMGTMAVLLFIFAPQVMSAFSSEEAVVRAGTDGLRVLVFAMPVLGVVFVNGGGMRGCGNTRTPWWIFGGGVWASIGLGALGLALFGGGLVTTSAAWAITPPIMAWLAINRFRATSTKLRLAMQEQAVALETSAAAIQ